MQADWQGAMQAVLRRGCGIDGIAMRQMQLSVRYLGREVDARGLRDDCRGGWWVAVEDAAGGHSAARRSLPQTWALEASSLNLRCPAETREAKLAHCIALCRNASLSRVNTIDCEI